VKHKRVIRKYYHYSYPLQAVLVTCIDKEGHTNIITIAWHTPVSSNPPLYGIAVSPKRYSHRLIEETKEFVVNFAPFQLVDKLHLCGSCSGKRIDKIAKTGLTLRSFENIRTPLIEECYAHLGCSLYKKITIGDHTFFIGKVEEVIVDEEAFPEDVLDNTMVKPVYYLGDNKYTTISEEIKVF